MNHLEDPDDEHPHHEFPGYVAGSWAIDPAHSEVSFTVRHLMVSKVLGRFTSFEGEIVTAADPLSSSVTATVDLASIDTSNADRDAQLRSADAVAHGLPGRVGPRAGRPPRAGARGALPTPGGDGQGQRADGGALPGPEEPFRRRLPGCSPASWFLNFGSAKGRRRRAHR